MDAAEVQPAPARQRDSLLTIKRESPEELRALAKPPTNCQQMKMILWFNLAGRPL
jgi:hypothetical protein